MYTSSSKTSLCAFSFWALMECFCVVSIHMFVHPRSKTTCSLNQYVKVALISFFFKHLFQAEWYRYHSFDMYIINIAVKPPENKNSHRKQCLSVTSGPRCTWSPVTSTHTYRRSDMSWTFFSFNPPWQNASDRLNPRKRLTGIQIQLLSQLCRRHRNSFIKTLQDRESFTINKRGKTLLLPLFS